MSQTAMKDYNRGRIYLKDMAKQKGVKLFKNLNEALSDHLRRA